MQLDSALTRLRDLVHAAEIATGDPAVLSENWSEIDTLLKDVIAPALAGGGALPLGEEKISEVENLVRDIAALEQKLQLKLDAIATFVPQKSEDTKG